MIQQKGLKNFPHEIFRIYTRFPNTIKKSHSLTPPLMWARIMAILKGIISRPHSINDPPTKTIAIETHQYVWAKFNCRGCLLFTKWFTHLRGKEFWMGCYDGTSWQYYHPDIFIIQILSVKDNVHARLIITTSCKPMYLSTLHSTVLYQGYGTVPILVKQQITKMFVSQHHKLSKE